MTKNKILISEIKVGTLLKDIAVMQKLFLLSENRLTGLIFTKYKPQDWQNNQHRINKIQQIT